MSNDGNSGPADPADCPLSPRQQTRNILLLTANWSLIYLASPVTYVGVLQASLCERLGVDARVANLPAAVALFATALPILVAWCFPRVRQLRWVMVASYATAALSGALVAGSLLVPRPAGVAASVVVVPALLVHAMVIGSAIGVAVNNHWEVLGRGVAASRRGPALALVFSAGPVLAVVGSVGAQLILAGRFNGFTVPAFKLFGHAFAGFRVPDLHGFDLEYPWNFAILFGASMPVLGLAALLSAGIVIPQPQSEAPRQPFFQGVFGGFGDFLSYRLILITTIAYILVYSGFMIISNVNLYTREAIGEAPEKYAGLQLCLRFACKIAAGFCFGWLLAWTNPKTLLVMTAGVVATGVAWALFAPGFLFLLSFGVLGAGELFGVYYPNYILGCTASSELRRNTALTSFITVPVGFAGIFYGTIANLVGERNKTLGFQASFVASILITLSAMLLVLIALPGRPRPRCKDADRGTG
jgi:hypothetical protein